MVNYISCYLCEKLFICPTKYFTHLKLCRPVEGNINYQCTFRKCFQKFNSKSVFKRHVFNHYKASSVKITKQSCTTNTNNEHPNSQIEDNGKNYHSYESTKTKDVTGGNISESDSYAKILNMLRESASVFLITLHSINNLSQSDINKIRENAQKNIICPIVQFLKTQVHDLFTNSNIDMDTIFHDINHLFQNTQTKHKLQKYMGEVNLISDPDTFSIANSQKSTGTLMPLEFQFQKIFETNYFLSEVLCHMEEIKKNKKIVNFIQGDLWLQKSRMYPNKTLIPYFLYVDDFGINNPIGSKSTKHAMCNVYYSFPCIPGKSSKLNTVFLACSLKSSDVKKFGINECFLPMMNLLRKMELEGIRIKTSSGEETVHFVMGLILGDNLGLNTMLSFSKSFSASYYCRFCHMKKEEAQKCCSEVTSLLRNRINYRESLSSGEMPKLGIESNSVFNTIPSFHATENYSVDLMHDIYEGTCHYIFTQCLLYFIRTMKYFKLDTLNDRLISFLYNTHDKGNEKAQITMYELEKRKLKLSARQMMSFCHYLPLIIGDLIPFGDVVWKYILLFLELIDDLLCYEISDNLLDQITTKIELLNREYQNLFKVNLTPKFHFLVHYPTIIKKSGPLRNIWSFKYEAKHKEFKIYAHVITSRKNIPKTFSFKQQMRFANFLLRSSESKEFLFKNVAIDFKTKELICRQIHFDTDDVMLYNSANIYGFQYNSKTFIAAFKEDINIYSVKYIAKTNTDKIFVCCQKILTEYNAHYLAYEIKTNTTVYNVIPLDDILGPPVGIIEIISGKQFVKLKEFYHSMY